MLRNGNCCAAGWRSKTQHPETFASGHRDDRRNGESPDDRAWWRIRVYALRFGFGFAVGFDIGFGFGVGIDFDFDFDFDFDIGFDIGFDIDFAIVNTAVLTIGRIVRDGQAVIRSRAVPHASARIEESADDAGNPQTFHVDFRR
ncbi:MULTISPECIES: hypothetical protein [unclassified Burkholderia]|uniref:hypothetical protein n=1 Tax=unclassified Burkholderia TaxID=2613784 RepID=UPI000F5B754A|nr:MULTISPECIES: hypothetical protein [unclassified Burkholderia]RQS22228.1 hypothetical protein DIE05_30265 [Burkholderia sp. Bp8995]RQS41709.1 hypothetical protein DIE00_28240 [Burkholderia sp. Bp8989]